MGCLSIREKPQWDPAFFELVIFKRLSALRRLYSETLSPRINRGPSAYEFGCMLDLPRFAPIV